MYLSKIKDCLPYNWEWNESCEEEYKLVKISTGNLPGLHGIPGLVCVDAAYRIESPFIYAQYLIKKDEYEMNGQRTVKELYHCTGQQNVESIAKTNLDYRRVNRAKFGQGVSFSPSMNYAHRQASRYIGCNRAMLTCDVLMGNCQRGTYNTKLPSDGYDTTVDGCGNVYVKYFDNEFYPKFHDDLKILEQIPILSNLLENNEDFDSESGEHQRDEVTNKDEEQLESSTGSSSKKNVSLYEWISAADNGNSIDKLFEHCHYGLTQVNKAVFDRLHDEIDKVIQSSEQAELREIKGLSDRLCGLEQLMVESKRYVQSQQDYAASFQQNQIRCGNLKDPTLLPDLCIFHVPHLHSVLIN